MDDASSRPSSHLASALDRKYSVFLNFFGPETRQGFVHHLLAALRQAGIRSFLDEDMMRGAEISAQMSSALRDSESSVVIFSEGYASSRWCLDELVKIIECQKTLGQLVFPIFYRLDPRDVRLQSGRFGEAFSELSERFVDHPGKVQRWKDALVHVGSLKGWVHSGESSEALLIGEIVKILRERLRGSYFPPPPPPAYLIDPSPPPPPPLDSTAVRTVQYDVFVSFRGTDTRYNFTSHLYAALARQNLRAFIDNEELMKGDEIAEVNLKAIEESRSSVIVLSKDYASSAWCLDELVKILDCRKTLGQLVVPIFYHVDPSDVRRQFEKFCAFSGKQVGSGNNLYRVRRWGEALLEVSNLAGWATSNMKSESFLLHEVVSSLSEKLRQTSLVGIDSRIRKVMKLLCLGSSDVGIVGIHGMAGVGKTTLVKAIYNRIHSTFNASCFVESFREYSGISALRKQLFSQISEEQSSSDDTVTNELGRAKVLIVLDDIRDAKELASLSGELFSFGPGSRIIITTRCKDVLTSLGVNCTYEVKGLDDAESLELFSRAAFGKGTPDKDYLELSGSILKYASGLPLALKVLGSTLHGSSKQAWEALMPQLKSLPGHQIPQVLRTSFDDLDDEEKDIFLDIACFFKGMNEDFVKEILDGFGFSSEIGIAVLIEKGLLTISDNRLMMHDPVQDMGRGIVRQENCSDVGKRSRLWDHDDVYQVLTTNTGTETIGGISLDLSKVDEMHLSPAAFSKMHNLRFLQISNQSAGEVCKLHLPEGLDSLPNELVFLHWHGYPLKTLPPQFLPDNLIELDMPYSHLERLWEGTMVLPNLKRIGLSYSRELIRVPELLLASKLEKLNLEGCASLAQFPVSVSCPRSLVILNLRGCKSLKTIADIVSLKTLEIVDLSIFSESGKNPQISWSLKELCLAGTGIGELPTFIKNLDRLVILDLENCKNLKSLPELPSSLEYLDAHNCGELEAVSASSFIYRGMASSFIFSNCFKLEHMADNIFPSAAQPEVQHVATASKQIYEGILSSPSATICFPGAEIPMWFDFSSLGSSITIELPSPPCNSQSTGFALCAVVSFENYEDDGQFNIECKCHFETKIGRNSDLIAHSGGWVGTKGKHRVIGSEHVFLWHDSFDLHGSKSVSFQFFPAKNRKTPLHSCSLQRCGVLPFSC
ncbi:unnamed protein product [Linum tenue]|uniref:ADP-ribosyl cyclase/cyclic ADP-ribose hydrolase n=1 Tax=Linum tenue TaxID=586396 RepID=A0AAV0RF18_9ROSI|nr:unnamed protein product [Linum tenue]